MNIIFGGMARSGNPGTQAIVFIGPFVIILGIVLGIVALCGIPKHGRKGLLTPALIGLTINIVFLVFILLAFTTGIRRFEKERALKAETETGQREQAR